MGDQIKVVISVENGNDSETGPKTNVSLLKKSGRQPEKPSNFDSSISELRRSYRIKKPPIHFDSYEKKPTKHKSKNKNKKKKKGKSKNKAKKSEKSQDINNPNDANDKDNNKKSDTIEIEIEFPETHKFWKNKFNLLKEELKKELRDGLPTYSKQLPNDEYFNNLIQDLENNINDINKQKEILAQILVHEIDQSTLNDAQLFEVCMKRIKNLTTSCNDLDTSFYMDFILGMATFQGYQVKHKFKPEEIDNKSDNIWELKNYKLLGDFVDLDEVNYVKQLRVWKTKYLNIIAKMIFQIEKLKPTDATDKIAELDGIRTTILDKKPQKKGTNKVIKRKAEKNLENSAPIIKKVKKTTSNKIISNNETLKGLFIKLAEKPKSTKKTENMIIKEKEIEKEIEKEKEKEKEKEIEKEKKKEKEIEIESPINEVKEVTIQESKYEPEIEQNVSEMDKQIEVIEKNSEIPDIEKMKEKQEIEKEKENEKEKIIEIEKDKDKEIEKPLEKKEMEIETEKDKEKKEKVLKPVSEKKEQLPSNQKPITLFFQKKSVIDSKPLLTGPVDNIGTAPKDINKQKEKNPNQIIFKSYGARKSKNTWDENRKFKFEEAIEAVKHPLINFDDLKSLVKSQMKRKKIGSIASKDKPRKILVMIHDSFKKYIGKFENSSRSISGTRPFFKYETLIDYDMDSEEENEEQNAENINDNDTQEGDDDIDEEDEEDFIVPDGYLSNEEKIIGDEDIEDDDNNNKFSIIPKKPTEFNNNKMLSNKPFYFSMVDYQSGKDLNLDEYLQNYKIIKFVDGEEFPLPIKKKKEPINSMDKRKQLAINENEVLKELVRAVHGCYCNKTEIIDEFITRYPLCSKNSIEKKIAEFAKKKKLENENKLRWVVTEETFSNLGMATEYDTILKIKFEDYKRELDQKEVDKKENLKGEEKKDQQKDESSFFKKVKKDKEKLATPENNIRQISPQNKSPEPSIRIDRSNLDGILNNEISAGKEKKVINSPRSNNLICIIDKTNEVQPKKDSTLTQKELGVISRNITQDIIINEANESKDNANLREIEGNDTSSSTAKRKGSTSLKKISPIKNETKERKKSSASDENLPPTLPNENNKDEMRSKIKQK